MAGRCRFLENIVITGAEGFIGRNLIEKLMKVPTWTIKAFDRNDNHKTLEKYLQQADSLIHLAGVNRPQKIKEFEQVNFGLTKTIAKTLERYRKVIPIIFSSSIQVLMNNPYGNSKKRAEEILIEYNKKTSAPIYIFRFPNIFGKGCRPNYNSVVATFCYNIARGKEILIHDPRKIIELVYIDDVIRSIGLILSNKDFFLSHTNYYYQVKPVYQITIAELAEKIYHLKEMYNQGVDVADLSDDFMKSLYKTYISYENINPYIEM